MALLCRVEQPSTAKITAQSIDDAMASACSKRVISFAAIIPTATDKTLLHSEKSRSALATVEGDQVLSFCFLVPLKEMRLQCSRD
jgi:hypothetical protein